MVRTSSAIPLLVDLVEAPVEALGNALGDLPDGPPAVAGRVDEAHRIVGGVAVEVEVEVEVALAGAVAVGGRVEEVLRVSRAGFTDRLEFGKTDRPREAQVRVALGTIVRRARGRQN